MTWQNEVAGPGLHELKHGFLGGCMFEEVSEPSASRLRRRIVLLSILYFGLAIAHFIKFLYTHQVDHGLWAAVWLVAAVLWAYKFRHFGDPKLTKLDIETPKQD
jgi:peptidoglycan/LPS O-acetylase OafA/YrhL